MTRRSAFFAVLLAPFAVQRIASKAASGSRCRALVVCCHKATLATEMLGRKLRELGWLSRSDGEAINQYLNDLAASSNREDGKPR